MRVLQTNQRMVIHTRGLGAEALRSAHTTIVHGFGMVPVTQVKLILQGEDFSLSVVNESDCETSLICRPSGATWVNIGIAESVSQSPP